MPVYKVKDYKMVDGKKAKKTKEEYYKETCKGKKIWYYKCQYKDIYGNIKTKKSKKYETKEEAQKEERLFLVSIGEQTINNYTFDEIFNEYIERHKKEVRPQTIIRHQYLYNYIGKNLGNIKIENLTLLQYDKFKNILDATTLSTDYKNRIHKLVIRLINYADKYYNCYNKVPIVSGGFKNPLERKKEMLFFTKEEFNKFISVVDEPIWKALFETLFYCGLRQGELQALNWRDIDFENGTININKTLTTKLKGQKYSIFPPKTKSSYRIIPMTNQLKSDLKVIYNIYINLDGFTTDWFVFGGIRPIPESTIQLHKNKYCEFANVKKIRIHDFRHSCASLLISKNADPVLVAKYLGHSEVSMTLNKYSHMYKSKLDEIIKVIET